MLQHESNGKQAAYVLRIPRRYRNALPKRLRLPHLQIRPHGQIVSHKNQDRCL